MHPVGSRLHWTNSLLYIKDAKPACSLACFFLTKLIALVPDLSGYMVAHISTYFTQ